MLLFLQFHKCILSKSLNQHPVITLCMFCSLQYRLFWNLCFSFYPLYFCLLRQSIVLLCAQISVWCLDYPGWKTKNHWCSVEAQFQDGAGSVPLFLLPPNAANTSFMDVCNKSLLKCPKMQSWKLWMLCWYSLSEWGSDRVAFSFASKGCQCISYA